MKPSQSLVLLVNLGSPSNLSWAAISSFLRKFLSDKRVVNLPKIFWYPILYGIILPFRSKKLLKQYKKIWQHNQSPLIYYTKNQASQLSEMLGNKFLVEYAFCYSSPTIEEVLTKLHAQYDLNQLLVIPLYPQFSSTTTSAVFDQLAKFYAHKKYLPTLQFIRSFYNQQEYIKSIVKKIQLSWLTRGKSEKLIFSYHSLPQTLITAGDSYLKECLATTQLIVEGLEIGQSEYIISFQSKFGKQQWLVPSTTSVLTDLAKSQITSVDIVCPGFVSDCLETLEEIALINKQVFISNGGSTYNYIECLNVDKNFMQLLFNLVNKCI